MSDNKSKIRVWMERAAFVLLTGLAAALIYFSLDYIISDDTGSLSRVTIHDFYEQDPIDLLFIGTSHTLYTMDSNQLTEDLNQSVFDLSVTGPDFIKMYYLLNEALRSKDIQHVWLEMSVSRLGIEGKNETGTYLITDYIKGLKNKAELIFNKLDADNYVNAVFRLRRNFTTIPTLSTIRETVNKKSQNAYTQYLGSEMYRGRGEWERRVYHFDNAIDMDLVDEISIDDLRDDEWEYLLRIMDLCKKKGVDLTLYAMPYTDVYLAQYEAYETLNSMVREEAEKRSIPFLDLNLVRKEFLQIESDEYKDYEHLNLEPGRRVSKFLVDYMHNPEGDWFYESLADRFEDGKIYGIFFDKTLISDDGVYETLELVEGRIKDVSIEVRPISVSGMRADIRISDGVYSLDKEWISFCDYNPVLEDGFSSFFMVPYDYDKQHLYRVSVFRTGTDELLFETTTTFGLTQKKD